MKWEWLEQKVRKSANSVGIDIFRFRPEATVMGNLATILASRGVDVVLDVGANVGQFARSLRSNGFAGQIVSFEPLQDAHATLQSVSRRDPNWAVAPRMALGNADRDVEINVSANSVSSSVLEMLKSHEVAAPSSEYVRRERVAMRRLDAVAAPYLGPGSIPFLKIDTQGYEREVLAGGSSVVSLAQGIQLELSLTPLYGGQALFDELKSQLVSAGFEIWSIWPVPGFTDPKSGRMLQVDAVFMRTR